TRTCCQCNDHHRHLHSFPTRRSSDLERRTIYRDDEDRDCFLELLGSTLARQSWSLFSFCLMKNHYHLLVRTPNTDLSAGMHFVRSEEHTSELQSLAYLVCRLLLEKKK